MPVQVIDYDELIKAQREGVNRYYYKIPAANALNPQQKLDPKHPSGFGPVDPANRWDTSGMGNYGTSKDMTPEQAKKDADNRYQTGMVKPEDVLNHYYPGWEEWEKNRGKEFDFEGFALPEMPEVTFESIYGMSEEEWKYQQEMKTDLAQLEPAWAARESAVTSATEAVDKIIRDQESYGALTGQDLTISEESRQMMISNMFADMFNEEQEKYISDIVDKYGLGDKYQRTVRRGQIGTFNPDESLALANRAGISGTVLTDNEDDSLGSEVILG